MLKKQTAMHFIALFSLISTSFYALCNENEEEKPKTFYATIVDRHLGSFGSVKKREIPTILPAQSLTDKFKALLAPNPLISPEFSKKELCQFAFGAQKAPSPSSILPLVTIDKTNLIAGPVGKGQTHLVSCLFGKRLKTMSGQTSAATQLTHLASDMNNLYAKQQLISALSRKPKVTKQLATTLEEIGLSEPPFYSYFEKPFIDNKFLEKVYWNLPFCTPLNNNVLGLELGTELDNIKNGLMFFGIEMIVFGSIGLPVHNNIRTYEQTNNKKLPYFKIFFNDTIASLKSLSAQQIGFFTGCAALYKIIASSDFKISSNIKRLLQTQLIGVATYINGARQLYAIINKHPDIANNFPGLKALKSLVKPSAEHSDEFNELIALLSTNTFTGQASCLSLDGRVLRAHTLMSNESVRREFAEIISAVGAIDVYTALAKQISTTADQSVKYSLVTFDTQSTKPYIKGTGLWNPFIAQDKAVTNDINLGHDFARNIILSGPNTGGKSTFAKTVLLNIILAQTFGIAAAENMIMTPFANLDCYLNMVDDITSGLSGLKAEVMRAKELLERIKTTNGFSFVLLDEIFTATSPDQAEKLAVEFISQLSLNDNVMFVDAAHFEGLIQFAEESPDCRNCHMGAIVDSDGRISEYTYKINEGRSTIKNAAQVAEDSFLKF